MLFNGKAAAANPTGETVKILLKFANLAKISLNKDFLKTDLYICQHFGGSSERSHVDEINLTALQIT